MLTVALVVLLIVLLVGGTAFPRLSTAAPDQSAVNIIWILAAVVLVALLLRLLGVWAWSPAGW